jgi:hypothetical protein
MGLLDNTPKLKEFGLAIQAAYAGAIKGYNFIQLLVFADPNFVETTSYEVWRGDLRYL